MSGVQLLQDFAGEGLDRYRYVLYVLGATLCGDDNLFNAGHRGRLIVRSRCVRRSSSVGAQDGRNGARAPLI